MSDLMARAMYDFERANEDELSFRSGDTLTIVSQHVGPGYEGWWLGRAASGQQGYVPENYFELLSPPEPSMPPPPPPPPQSYAAPAYQQQQQQQWQPPAQPAGSFFADESWSSDEDRGHGHGAGGRAAAPPMQQQQQQQQQQPQQPPSQTPALRKSASVTLSTTSAEAAAAAATRADARKTIRGLPKIAGIREFLLTDDTMNIGDVDAICLTMDGDELAWQATSPAFACKVAEPSKTSKMRGLKTYIAYQISCSANPNQIVSRRYKQFDWLHKQLADKFPCVAVAPLPDKQVTGRYEENFVNARMRQLQTWMNRMSAHPVVGPSLVFQHFLTCTDDGKRWKEGKRRAEQDRLTRGQVYHTIRLTSSCACDLTGMERFTEAFDGFAAEIDSATRLTLNTVLSHSSKCQANVKKEYARIADACFAMEKAAGLVPNEKLGSLAQAMKVTGQAYQQVSDLWGEQPRRDCDPLAEALHEYTGVISCLPGVVSLGRGAVQTARECQRGLEEGRMSAAEAQEASRRSAVVCAAQCAEMNHFRRGLEQDYRAMMAEFLREQVRFHQEIASKLQSALDSFSY